MQYFKTLYMYDFHPKISRIFIKYFYYFHITKVYEKMPKLTSGNTLTLIIIVSAQP